MCHWCTHGYNIFSKYNVGLQVVLTKILYLIIYTIKKLYKSIINWKQSQD